MTQKTPSLRRALTGALALLLLAGCPDGIKKFAWQDEEVLKFQLEEANVRNYFFRQGPIAVHELTTSGMAPRVVWGFPADNTGIGIWFYPPAQPVQLKVESEQTPVEMSGGMLGVSSELTAEAPVLRVQQAVLGNVRTVRDYFYGLYFNPSGVRVEPQFRYSLQVGPPMVLTANAVDGKHHIRLMIQFLEGTTGSVEGENIVFRAGSDGHIHLKTTALTDYTPLTPFNKADLVTSAAANNEKALNALAFLTYKEKMLAGSWRFLTYFGRDSLLSMRMLMPVLKPEVMEAGLGAVLNNVGRPGQIDDVTKTSADGVVAHEEALGDYSWYTRVNLKVSAPPPPQDMFSPWFDYKMIDADYILPAVIAEYAKSPQGKDRIAAFLARKTPAGESFDSVLKRNIEHVMATARPFAAAPTDPTKLVSIKHPEVGNWRDSGSGLGGGKYPYDVNVALVPAALRGAAYLYSSGALGNDAAKVTELTNMAEVWEANAPGHFLLTKSSVEARSLVTAYANSLGLDAAPAVASITTEVPYRAVSLDASGVPVPIMNSDDGFVMEFTNPSDAYLQEAAGRILRPFPAGLRTDSGVVVANAVFASDTLKNTFTRGDYHGCVIWSWQQAMLAAGLERQLARTDLQPATVTQLKAAQTELWKVITASQSLGTGELWSWKPDASKKAIYDSFADAAISENRFVDESNAAQLWSTVYLAVQKPAAP